MVRNFAGDQTAEVDLSQVSSVVFMPTHEPATTYQAGDVVDGSYELLELLGRGGMGVVFRCHHPVLDRDYALKLLYGDELNAELWERFKDEAKALARLKHPDIVGIHNMGIDRGVCPFYVMDLLSGETLDSHLRECGRLDVSLAIELFIHIADALASAHARGIIHRDIKPSNLMLVRDSANNIVSIKIVDFGIASVSKIGSIGIDQKHNAGPAGAGLISGTPFYMSPEQCQGAAVDHRSDIYSLGCTLFEALIGVPPFRGKNTFHTFILHQNCPAPTLASGGLGGCAVESLDLALGRMLAKDPDRRYQSMYQVRHDLERIKNGKPIVARTASDDNSIAIGAFNPGIAALSRVGCFEKIASCFGALCVLVAGVVMSLYFALPAAHNATGLPTASHLSQAPDVVQTFVDESGADIEEVDRMMTDGTDTAVELQKFIAVSRPCIADAGWRQTRFKTSEPVSAFRFPSQFAVGAIKVGDGEPVPARGVILAPVGKRVCLYWPAAVTECPEILAKFGLDDATGLEGVFRKPREVLPTLARWKNLDELCFFNSLLKALPNCENFEESKLQDADLALIDSLSQLKSLGLCGPSVSGGKIIGMKLFASIDTLKVKRISDQETLLAALPARDNIKELWLVGLNTTDDQLQYLTRMKNLETLRIRGSRLTPASLDAFLRMPSLKHIRLDRNSWSEADRNRFKQQLPDCRFEKVVDSTFWYLVPR
ncbi:MAG: serine/threonine protein kinase [Cyanobacteria bacterium SZAS LIN-3]|nr:serine/threonine protein kinase [Cyanobacteria bacterium SZAS LIN-3]